MKKSLLFLTFIISNILWANETSKLRSIAWEEISHKEDIKVYVPQNYFHGSGLLPIRFEAKLNFEISKVLTVLADNKRKTEWIPRGKVVKMLEKKSEKDFTVYYKYNLPWPIQDRDFIIRNIGRIHPDSNVVSVDLISVDHPDDPNKKDADAVRGKTIDGYTIIKSLNDNETFVEMALLTDFEGMIPVWIINSIQKKWPYRFISNLRKQLSKADIVINPEYIIKKAR